MKKFVSYILICSILLFHLPINSCCSIDSEENISKNYIKNDYDNKSKKGSCSVDSNNCCDSDKGKIKGCIDSLNASRFRDSGNVRFKKPIKKIRVRRFKNNRHALFKLKKDILEISKDKNFVDVALKNYRLLYEDPLWLKCIKMPFSIVYSVCKKLIDYTVGYLIGRKASDFIENVIVPGVMCLALYKKVPWVKQNVDWLIDYFFDGNENDK